MAIFVKTSNCKDCISCPSIFKILSKSELNIINENRYEVKFNSYEIIFKQGTSLTHLLCIFQGLAKAYIEVSNNRNLILKILKPNELVGGPGMHVDYRHHFSVAAIEDLTACLIEIESFKHVLRNNIEFAMELLKLVNIQGIYNFERFVSLTQKQMPGRIADAIIYLSKEVYNSSSFNLSFSRQELADLTAMSKESAIRILKEFNQQGIIDLKGSNIEIKDSESLNQISKTG